MGNAFHFGFKMKCDCNGVRAGAYAMLTMCQAHLFIKRLSTIYLLIYFILMKELSSGRAGVGTEAR